MILNVGNTFYKIPWWWNMAGIPVKIKCNLAGKFDTELMLYPIKKTWLLDLHIWASTQ